METNHNQELTTLQRKVLDMLKVTGAMSTEALSEAFGAEVAPAVSDLCRKHLLFHPYGPCTTVAVAG